MSCVDIPVLVLIIVIYLVAGREALLNGCVSRDYFVRAPVRGLVIFELGDLALCPTLLLVRFYHLVSFLAYDFALIEVSDTTASDIGGALSFLVRLLMTRVELIETNAKHA